MRPLGVEVLGKVAVLGCVGLRWVGLCPRMRCPLRTPKHARQSAAANAGWPPDRRLTVPTGGTRARTLTLPHAGSPVHRRAARKQPQRRRSPEAAIST
jgi:hypothetical protein